MGNDFEIFEKTLAEMGPPKPARGEFPGVGKVWEKWNKESRFSRHGRLLISNKTRKKKDNRNESTIEEEE